MKLDDLVKDLTKRAVYLLETPKEERTKTKIVKEPWKSRWFGVVPMAISLVFKKKGR